VTEPPNTEARDLATAKESAKYGYNHQALAEARVEALLATVREIVDCAYDFMQTRSARSHTALRHSLGEHLIPREGIATLDAIASELKRLRQINSDVVDVNTEACNRADAAEAELERVRAERDAIGAALGEACAECGHIDWRSDGYADRFLGLQARLNRAVEALREIADWPLGYGIDTKARNRARVALAEIEESG
jgi:hypothetical protein